jgi:hypothetical protein
MARPERLMVKLALLGFGLVMSFGIGEAVVRIFRLGPNTNVVYRDNYRLSDNPRLQYELIPGSRDGQFKISAAGIRDKEYALPKPPGVFRILVIGDSIVYGFGIPQSDPISEQMEELLQRQASPRVSRFEVLNLGVTGYNMDQVVENLRTRGMSFRPDLIVYGYCLNDPEAGSFELDSLKAQLSPAQLSYRDHLLRGERWLVDQSRLLLLLRYVSSRRSEPARPVEVSRDKQWLALADGSYTDYFAHLYTGSASLARLRHGVEELQGIARSAGVPLVAAVFPVFVDLRQYRLGPLHAAVDELFRSKQIPTYDLLTLYATMFQMHGSVFVLNALHPNALGHRLAALYLVRELTRDGYLPASAQRPTPSGEMAELDKLLEPVVNASERRSAAEPALAN